MKRLMQGWINAWDNFWWADVDPSSLKATRVTFGISVLLLYSVRFFRMDFYNEKSMIPKDLALDLLDSYQRPWFSWNFWPDSWAYGVHALFMVLILLFTLGYTRRPLMILAWILHVGFLHRNFGASMGVDIMVAVFLFYLSFAEVWRKAGYDILTRTMIRMLQVHLGIIYFYTGLEKLRGSTWWEGSSLWIVFNNPQMSVFNLEWTRNIPSVLALLAHTTVLFEVFFIALVFNRKTRILALGLGFMFHTGTALLMDLWAFAALMLSQYFLFLKREDWENLNRLSKQFRI